MKESPCLKCKKLMDCNIWQYKSCQIYNKWLMLKNSFSMSELKYFLKYGEIPLTRQYKKKFLKALKIGG